MAITLRHDVVGFGAKGDNGSQRKFGQNLVLQQQQMTQENMQRAQDRVFELGKMDIANRNQRLRDNRMVQADKDMAAIRLKAENDRFVQGRKFQQQDMEAQNQQNWLMGNTRNLEAQVGELRGRMAQNQYTPEGQKLYGDLAGALRAIESQRDGIRPKEYNKLLSDWLNNAERSGLEKFVAPAPTVKTEMEGRFHDLGNGNALILQPDGEMRVQKLEKQEDQSDPRVYFNDKATYSSARKQAESSLAQRFEKNNPTAESVPDFSAEDIHAEMLREFDDHQGLLKKLSPQAQPDAGMPASPSSPPMESAPVQPVAPPPVAPQPPSVATVQPAPETNAQQQLPKQPGALSAQETEYRNQLMAMPRRDRVEQLLPFHPEAKGRTLEQMLDDPVAKEEYKLAVSQGLMEPGKYEEYALEILDSGLTKDLGILKGKDAAPGLSTADIKDKAVKDKLEALPRPSSDQEAMLVEGKYFTDPEGNRRILPASR